MKDVPATMSAGRKTGKDGCPAAEGELRMVDWMQPGVVRSVVGRVVGVGSGTRAPSTLKWGLRGSSGKCVWLCSSRARRAVWEFARRGEMRAVFPAMRFGGEV